MSIWIESWDLAISGFRRFITDYKYTALVICVLVYAFMHWRQYEKRLVRIILLYTAMIMALLMIPFTCGLFLYYQTRFYDYEWIWSLVPMTIVLAWGIVVVVFREIPKAEQIDHENDKRLVFKRICGFLAAAAVLFMCGNQGRVQEVNAKEMVERQKGAELLNRLEEENLLQDHVIWAQSGIMQYMRSNNGQVILFYGRDMWDAKSGAYDYEIYSGEEIACYEWMEEVSSDLNHFLLEVNQAPDNLYESLASDVHIRNAVLQGVDTIILSAAIDDWMKQKMQLVGDENGLAVTSMKVEEYTIWMFRQRGYDE